jgi:triacylglycerol lipase
MAFEPRATSFSLANAQILAQASAVAYDTPERCAKWASVSGFTGAFDFFDSHDTQGFVVESGDAIIVAFRGTQPNRPMDWFVDFRATSSAWDHNAGKVHSGSMHKHYLVRLKTSLPV